MQNSGIYILYYETDDYQYYIGLSTNINERYNKHCNSLRNNTHHNYKLQLGYQVNGELPSISILEYATENLEGREVYWIDKFDSFHNGMNLTIGGESSSGQDNNYALYTKEQYVKAFLTLVNTDKRLVDISKELHMSISVIKAIAEGSGHKYLEIEYPSEYKELENKLGTRNRRVYTDNEYKEVLFRLAYSKDSLYKIAEELNISYHIVADISAGRNKFLINKYPKEYHIILLKGNRKAGKSNGAEYPIILCPEGEEYQVTNTTEFARQYGLQQGNLHKVLTGERKSHKGWKLK